MGARHETLAIRIVAQVILGGIYLFLKKVRFAR